MGTNRRAAADVFTGDMDMSHLPDSVIECVETADGFGRVFRTDPAVGFLSDGGDAASGTSDDM